MKKSTIQIIVKVLAILLVIAFAFSFTTNVFADGELATPGDFKAQGGKLDTDLNNKINNILGTINTIAVIAAVAVIMFIGIKYILGSVEEKAEYKKIFLPLIIGIILVVGATSIATWIFNIVSGSN